MNKHTVKALLKNDVVKIVFEKADGTTRTMNATLLESYLPLAENGIAEPKTPNEEVHHVWDVDADDWRAFRWDRLKYVNHKEFKQ